MAETAAILYAGNATISIGGRGGGTRATINLPVSVPNDPSDANSDEGYHWTLKAGALKASCEADLNEAMPALHAAVKALDTLKKDDITFLKQLKKPPQVIRLVMHAVCIMFGEKAKKYLRASPSIRG